MSALIIAEILFFMVLSGCSSSLETRVASFNLWLRLFIRKAGRKLERNSTSPMTLENTIRKAKAVARRARDLGFGHCEFVVRDIYDNESYGEAELEDLIRQYRPGDTIGVEVMLALGNTKVPVRAA
jgi:hypothetical protein